MEQHGRSEPGLALPALSSRQESGPACVALNRIDSPRGQSITKIEISGQRSEVGQRPYSLAVSTILCSIGGG